MSKILSFFNNLKATGAPDSNAAIQAFENDNNKISLSFIRELIQNAIDAALNKELPVKLVFKLVDIQSSEQKTIKELFKEILPFIKFGHNSQSSRSLTYDDDNLYAKALVVEEYNTIGLTGTVDRTNNEQPTWHYSNYMFGVNRKTKLDGGGSAGVGKITSNLVSDLRNIFFITNRSDDNKTWLGGRTAFEAPYTMGGTTFADTAYLTEEPIPSKISDMTGNEEDKILQPVASEDAIDWFKEVFQIDRNNVDCGTSWVMVAPLHETDEVSISPLQSIDQYLDIILSEYFWAIMKGSLEVQLGHIVLDKESIYDFLDTRFPKKTETWEFFQEIQTYPANSLIRLKPDWADHESLDTVFLSDDDRQNAIDNFDSGSQVVGFKIPITVTKETAKESSFIEIYIRKKSPQFNEHSEYLFRDYLHISGESKNLKNGFGDSVDCALMIEDSAMVEICRAAEKPDHTKFVNSRAKARGFKSVSSTFSNLRKSVKSIYNFLIELDTADENIFSSVFGVLTPKDNPPSTGKKRKKQKTGRGGKTYASPDRVDIQASQKKFLLCSGKSDFPQTQLPKSLTIKVYEKNLSGVHDLNADDDGFENTKTIKLTNITITDATQDSLKIEILDNDFLLELDNFNISRTSEIRLED